jgi:GTP-binding protein YchF
MKAGLVGFPQTGKTTLFEALTGQPTAASGSTRTAKSGLGVVRVPDARVARLSGVYRPRKTTYAEVVFVDTPRSKATPSGLDAAMLQAVAEADALVVVLRGFPDLGGAAPNPERELQDFEAELILGDLGAVERRLERLAKTRDSDREKAVLERCLERLGAGSALRHLELSPEQEKAVSSFAFLSRRPLLVVLNTSEKDVEAPLPAGLTTLAHASGARLLAVCAAVEAEIARLPEVDQADFLASMGIGEPASARLIRSAYALLDYISFFTVGEDEVRAWTVRRGSLAPRAAGRVHSDIERGFIRAEVMSYDEFIEAGSEARMKSLGRFRVEGKDYVVQDGDIVNFRFNV